MSNDFVIVFFLNQLLFVSNKAFYYRKVYLSKDKY